jgi:cob(I)alamin adenosyltransferase
MKIYTKTGDKGSTGLLGGSRVAKHHIRIDSYGTIDELNSWLGLIRDQEMDDSYKQVILQIQSSLFTIGAILASEPKTALSGKRGRHIQLPDLKDADVRLLEDEIDKMNENLAPMTNFILPGGHSTVSYCHIARTVCRRAERLISELHQTTPLNGLVLEYSNRLSDYLFVLARKLSADLNANEIKWIPDRNP